MTTLVEFIIIAGADNRPPMLEKSLYDSWKSHMEHYMENRENGRMILNSVQNGPLIWLTVTEEDGTTRIKKYEELSATEKIQADCDCKATNIVLQGLSSDVYAIVNHHKVAKEIWDRVKLLMQGTKLSLQEKEFQVNTRFLNSLPPEWSKFVTDVKLARDLHTTKYDQLYSYLEQHERHANETRLMRERYQDPLAFVANYIQSPSQLKTYHSQYNPIHHSSVPPSQHYQSHQTSSKPQIAYTTPQPSTQPLTEFPQLDSGLGVLVFNQGDDPIAYLNKAMAFLTTVASSRFPSTNNQLRTSSNLRNQAIIQDRKVTIQQVQGRQGQSYAGNSYKGNATSYGRNNTGGQARVVKCYTCQGKGYVARQCSQPKRTRNVAWFKEKAMLAEAQEAGQILDEEQLAFLADPGIPDGQTTQTTIPNTTAFQTEDLDAYDSDCDDVSNAKAVLMANLSNYGSDVISKVPHSDSYHIDMDDQSVRAMQDFKQTPVVDFSNNEIHSDSNIILYSQYLQETQQAAVQDTNVHAQQDSMILSMIEQMSEQMITHVNNWEKANQERNNESLTTELVRYKERVKTFEQRLNIDLSTQPSDEQAFWLQTSHTNTNQFASSPVKIEAPRELPKVGLVNTSLKKLKYHLGQFVTMVKKRITPDALTEGEWGFEHNKAVFFKEIILFLKTLKDIFNVFDKDLLNEVTKVQIVFNQIEAAVQHYFVDKQCFEIHKKELFLKNDRLLQKIMSQDVMICVMNSSVVFDDVNVEMQSSESCVKCLNLDAELLNKQNEYNDLSKLYSQLEKHCISLELTMQLNQENFQKEPFTNNQNALEILKYFKNNDLKAQLQAKDTTICKFQEHIKTMRENDKEEKVKHEMDEIETINIELAHSVAKLLSENERLHKEIKHLKKIYKDQFDSIKKTRALSKEHNDSLIAQLNSKSMENVDLKHQLQDKLDLDPLAPILLQNMKAHIYYLKHTKEQANILKGIVKQTKAKQPLDNVLDLACKHAKRIQELLVYVRDTCPNAIKLSEKKVAVTPMNKVKKVKFSEPLTSSSNIKQCSTSTCRSHPIGNKKNDRILLKPSSNKKNKVEAQPRKVNKKNRVKEPMCDDNVKHTMLNLNSQLICVKCKQCMFDADHDVCFLDFVNDVNMHTKSKSKSKKSQVHNIWKPTGKVFTDVGLKWKLTRKLFTIVGNSSPLTRITPKKIVHLKETTSNSVETPKPEIKVYSRRPKQIKSVEVPSSSYLFNDRVYHVEGLGHNLFSVGQFCDADLEVAFQKNTCFIRNLEGVDLLSGSRDTNVYTISLDEMLKTSPICLLSKASKTKSWLWHHRLSHLNFNTLNKLAKDGLARGIPKLKF
ncbi:retrovirus-related pol polyprotein from transposon TNT 1-94 [Tanacetum coccineum]